MIFVSKNEKGEVAWKLIKDGRKTVTRRLKPVSEGKILAVQPGRGKKAVGYIRVISCIPEAEWVFALKGLNIWNELVLLQEANREGFDSWQGLISWFNNQKTVVRLDDTFRIEFELVKQ